MFQPISKTFKMPTGDIETMIGQESKGFPEESIKYSTTPGNKLAPKLKCIYNSKIVVEFNKVLSEIRKSNFYS